MPEWSSPIVAESEASSPSLLYEIVTVEGSDGARSVEVETGSISNDVLQRLARPRQHRDEPTLHDHAWTLTRDDGTIERGYRIYTTPAQPIESIENEDTWVDPSLVAWAEGGEADSSRLVSLQIKGFPDWDLPYRPVFPVAAEEVLAAVESRAQAAEQRADLFSSLSAPLLEHLESHGAEVLATRWEVGGLVARVSPATAATLLARNDLRAIADVSAQGEYQNWALGDSRSDARLSVDRFHNNGFTGEQPNPAFHSYDDITIAILDGGFEDEACMFYDGCSGGQQCVLYSGCSGSSRIQARIDCAAVDGDTDYCEPVTDLTGSIDADDCGTCSLCTCHGTQVASIILGSYQDREGKGQALGDPAWTSGDHATSWCNASTGMAPESSVVLYGSNGPNPTAVVWWEAMTEAWNLGVDIFNLSAGLTTGACNPVVTTIYEGAAENLFDDGILVVAAAGNLNGTEPGCSTLSPADTLKVFSATGYSTGTTNCQNDTNRCNKNAGYGNGGMDVTLADGTVATAAITSNDVVAPGSVKQTTRPDGTYGLVSAGGFGGTSAAAPFVSGIAAVVKDHQLAVGNSWINLPGRLHTMLLLMGDRHYLPPGSANNDPTVQTIVAGDPAYGFGRLRPRLFGTGGGLGAIGTAFFGLTFYSNTTNFQTTLWSAPMPANTGVLKCVMFQHEDMSSKTRISNLNLETRTFAPSGGTCGASGTSTVIRTDSSDDVKSMVAFATPNDTLAGRCARLAVLKNQVTTEGVTANVFCYFSTVKDDAAPTGP